MFFRTKTIKGASLLQLVESYRNTEGQPRQRVVVSLGDAKVPDAEKSTIARAVENHLHGQSDLLPLDLSEEAAGWVRRILQLAGRSKSARPVSENTIDGVIIDRVESENVVQLGPQLVALEAWKRLGLGAILEESGLNPSQIATAQLLVANRLIEPSSEWALVDWAERTALPEMLDLRVTKSGKDRLYRAGDALFARRKAIEAGLRASESDLFGAHGSIVLYDMTNTHFEGLCEKNPKARHGKNKQKRNDCRQVAIGMAFDSRGLALAHDVFEGNIAETKTLATMLDRLAAAGTGTAKPVVILDAGFATAKNIALLKERGLGYVINITRSSRVRYAQEFAAGGFQPVPGRNGSPPVEVKSITDPDDPEGTLVLCRSALRREKEAAMLSGAETRLLNDATALRARIETGKLKDRAKIERAIGRLQKKHPRAARLYTLSHESGTLSILRDEQRHATATELLGDYVLKTERALDAAQTWSLYMILLQAEEGFACLKGTLGLRPNFHQLEHRVEAHIFISVLAYHLLTWVRETLRHSSDQREWKTLRRLLSTHCVVTTVLPLKTGTVLRIRKPSRPDAEQQRLYDKLGIDWKAAFPAIKSTTAP
jgi:transposase